MNVLFLVFSTFLSIEEKNTGIYGDLVREFVNDGHTVYRLYPVDELNDKSEQIFKEQGQVVVKTTVGRIRGSSNMIAKGINTVLLEPRIKAAVKKYFSRVHFDLVLYATPPITFYSAVKYVIKRDSAMSYLMLKDIFPQGAVDLGMLSTSGPKSIIYRMFRNKEKKLYDISDYIGCMSPANRDYLLSHNSFVNEKKVELLPNSIKSIKVLFADEEIKKIRIRYKIPEHKIVFVYGGNLGKPQGIPFIIELLKEVNKRKAINSILYKAHFIIVGDGSEYYKLKEYSSSDSPDNLTLIPRLEQEEYDKVISCCDIGLIFLDYRFTIPNFPSRLLSYMQAQMPVLCFTDSVSDIGDIVVAGHFGWKGRSDDAIKGTDLIESICNHFDQNEINQMKEKSWNYLVDNYNVTKAYSTIIKHSKV